MAGESDKKCALFDQPPPGTRWSGFRRCGRPVVGTCNRCGVPMCGDHTDGRMCVRCAGKPVWTVRRGSLIRAR